MQLRPDIDPVEGPPEVESDFTDLHAWAEVYLPGAGWIGFDVTSGMLTGEGHIPSPPRRITVLLRRSPQRRLCQYRIRFEMSVKRIRERRGSQKPFSDQSWERLDRLGEQVDVDLRAATCG